MKTVSAALVAAIVLAASTLRAADELAVKKVLSLKGVATRLGPRARARGPSPPWRAAPRARAESADLAQARASAEGEALTGAPVAVTATHERSGGTDRRRLPAIRALGRFALRRRS